MKCIELIHQIFRLLRLRVNMRPVIMKSFVEGSPGRDLGGPAEDNESLVYKPVGTKLLDRVAN